MAFPRRATQHPVLIRMSQSKAYSEKSRRAAALHAAKPDARFLVQLLAGYTGLASMAKNKTAPELGAAAYSIAMDPLYDLRASKDAGSLDRAA